MSDLPKTMEYEDDAVDYRSSQLAAGGIVRKADAMHDELLARIAELEASLKLLTEFGYWKGRAEQAEAALAERDRMLEDACRQMCGLYLYSGWAWEPILADLRARAEEGSKDE